MAGDPGVGGLHSLLRLVGSDLPGTGQETKTVQKDAEVVEWNSDSQIYWKILEADPEQIHFKSRLLTMLKR